MEQTALLLIVSGPAGSGKTTLCQRMVKTYHPEVQRVVTATTRPPRNGEIDGEDYYFLSPHEFEKRVEDGEFFEDANVHIYRYGILKNEIHNKLAQNIDLVLSIDVQGADTIRLAAEKDSILAGKLTTVFISPKDLPQLRERLVGRGQDDSDEIERRLQTAHMEMKAKAKYDHHIQSSSREEDFAALAAIYQAEKLKRGHC